MQGKRAEMCCVVTSVYGRPGHVVALLSERSANYILANIAFEQR